jgi:hypothetical protein
MGNGWYLEGMTRCLQDVTDIGDSIGNAGTYIPRTKKDILDIMTNRKRFADELSGKAYTAANPFWRPLFELSEGRMLGLGGDPYLNLRYADGSLIMKDFNIYAPKNLDLLFRNIERESLRCAKEQSYCWTTTSDERNNNYLTKAVADWVKEVI